MIDYSYPNALKDLVDIFETGLAINPDANLLGYRPQVSANPLKFADHYVWQSWPEVDARRRAVGSAVHKMFQTKELSGGDFETVGIWSKNSSSMPFEDVVM